MLKKHLRVTALIQWLIATFCAALLAGCVSTVPPSKYQVDEEKALDSHVTLALKYIEAQNRESARHHLRKAFEIDSRSVDATFAMAMLYQLEGEPEMAEEYFKKTLRLDKNYTRGRNNYGVFLYNHERYQDAYEQFEIAAEDLDYDNRAQAMVNLGRTAIQLDKPEKAESVFEHANRLDPALPTVKYELAALNFTQKDYAEAKKYLDAYEQIARPVPQTLLLGIKIERIFGNQNKEASYALLLKNRYPYSPEYLEYKQMLEN
ncbi:type IV pilus biogenesis/stability protein PilW [Gilvimarinus sp. DA14]|uniref:type IV pilus biogenesis/stability protein PilW n=1 Tax=Gilvimarinus sp. DA14 TaxID=2956798 RepID=UPI0020B7BE8B|nr:type IV pilus biogenesis/stability protein PilW [Gilvimarinus sp. DA14]UTF60866.1 type IV pilus biogenesis/stability protein PilW [Gilvimarinus sp. DA14]